jgi:rhodanese-related sulfurtransferase
MWPFRRGGAGGAAGPAPVSIDVAEAFARSRRGAKLIDVRSAAEFRTLHPKGARNVPPELIARDATGLSRDAELLVICLSGHRSQHQARKLVELGYTNVADVHGGLNSWKKAGLPVAR